MTARKSIVALVALVSTLGLACGRAPSDDAADASGGVAFARADAGLGPGDDAGAASASSRANESLDERAARVHRDAIIVDGHNDIPSVMADTGFDLGDDGSVASHPGARKTHTDLRRMKAGGITGEFFSIYVDKSYAEKGGAARRALDLIDVTYRQVERHKEDLVLATRADDIERAKRDGKIAVLMGIEGGHAIESSLFSLRAFYRLGVRYMTLTHTNTNEWADSAGFSGPFPVKHHGLTPFGKDVVREMQRIGMLVDVSHVSDETFYDVMKAATCPVIASHSSARAIADHRRNLSDDMLRALAKNGGVAMVNFWPAFIDPAVIAASADPRAPKPETKLEVLIDHIVHIAEIAGYDHVGLGSDFDGVPALPRDLDGIDKLPNITRALLLRGVGEADVAKVLGGSFLRVFREAEACAQATHTSLSGDGSTSTLFAP